MPIFLFAGFCVGKRTFITEYQDLAPTGCPAAYGVQHYSIYQVTRKEVMFMSFRPTISVYINGRIVDIGYYRNWDEKSLLYEAVAIAALYEDCRSAEEYLQRKFGRQRISYVIEPETFENTEENLKWFEDCSEWPILVDLTARCIYMGTEAKSEEELRRIPDFDEDVIGYRKMHKAVWRPGTCEEAAFRSGDYWGYCRKNKRYKETREEVPGYHEIDPGTEFADLLDYSKIPFDRMDLKEVLRCLKAWPDAGGYLSEETIKKLAAA